MEQRRPNQNQNLPDPEKRKKIFLWLVVFIAAFSVIFFSVSYLKKSSSEKAKKEVTQQKEKGECGFANDQAAYQKAKEDKDPLVCLCLGDEQVRIRCQEEAQNEIAFAQASAQFNGDLCALIKDNIELQDACEVVVSSGIEYLKQKDPKYLAQVFSQNNNYNQAIEILSELEKTESEDVEVTIDLALNYADKGLAEHKEGEFVPKALALIEKAIALDPQNPEVYRAQGFIYEVQPDLNKSIESYNQSLEKNPNYIPALAGRGHAHNLLGDLEKALTDFRKAAELDKNKENIFIWANLCRLETSRDDMLAKGIENCQVVLSSSVTSAELKSEAHQILGEAYTREKKFEEALTHLESARVFSPHNVNLMVSLAKLYTEKGDYEKAVTQSQEALSLDPLKASAYWTLAFAYFKIQDYAQAEEKALKGLETVKQDPSLLLPNKPALEQQFNYLLADIFSVKGDQTKEAQYKEAGDRAIKYE